jgi:hypothetical protein
MREKLTYHLGWLTSHYYHISARRPPVEETVMFLESLLSTHGPDYFVRLLGEKASNNMAELGGVHNVAIVLSGRHKQFLLVFKILS